MSTEAAPQFVTEARLAELFDVEPTLLERLRHEGSGPPHVRIAPRTIRYPLRDALRWAEEHSVSASTAVSGASRERVPA